jgi:hypothetical protein
MRTIAAVVGSVVFLLIAPGVVAGLVPWWLTGGRMTGASPGAVQITGAVLAVIMARPCL